MIRYKYILNELDAIASCELESELGALRADCPLTLEQTRKLQAYLNSELGDCGLLSLDHLAQSQDRADARKIRTSAQALLRSL